MCFAKAWDLRFGINCRFFSFCCQLYGRYCVTRDACLSKPVPKDLFPCIFQRSGFQPTSFSIQGRTCVPACDRGFRRSPSGDCSPCDADCEEVKRGEFAIYFNLPVGRLSSLISWLFGRLWRHCHLSASWPSFCEGLSQCSICAYQYPDRSRYAWTSLPVPKLSISLGLFFIRRFFLRRRSIDLPRWGLF